MLSNMAHSGQFFWFYLMPQNRQRAGTPQAVPSRNLAPGQQQVGLVEKVPRWTQRRGRLVTGLEPAQLENQ